MLPFLAAASLALATAGAAEYRIRPITPFGLQEFAAAVFDSHDTDLGAAAAVASPDSTRVVKVNFTSSVAVPDTLIAELSYLTATAFDLERLWRVEFEAGSGGSKGRISEHELSGSASEFDEGKEKVFKPLCAFDMKIYGLDAAFSAVRDEKQGTLCTLTAFALNDSKRAHLSLQVTDTKTGAVVRSLAMHRRETTVRKSNWEEYGHYVLFILLFGLQIALRIWKNSKAGQKWAASGREAAAARERAAAAREYLQADGAPAAAGSTGGAEAKKEQ